MDLARLEIIDEGLALRSGCVADNRLATHASRADRVADMEGMVYSSAENEPAISILAIGDDLINRSLCNRVQIDVTGVGTRGGEFIAKDLEAAVDQDSITRPTICT